MLQSLSERTIRVLFFARFDASRFGSPAIGSDHLLLGVLREDQGDTSGLEEFTGGSNTRAGAALAKPILRREAATGVRLLIESRIAPQAPFSETVDIPLAAAAQEILSLADSIRSEQRHEYLEPIHILSAAYRIGESQSVLSAGGIDPAVLERALAELPRKPAS